MVKPLPNGRALSKVSFAETNNGANFRVTGVVFDENGAVAHETREYYSQLTVESK